MPEETAGSQAGSSNGNPAPVESPGGKPMGAIGIALITVYLTLVAIVVFHSLVVLWPPLREETNKEAQAISDRLERIEKVLIPGTEEGDTPGGAETAGGTTTEPLGSDLTADDPRQARELTVLRPPGTVGVSPASSRQQAEGRPFWMGGPGCHRITPRDLPPP